MKIHIPVLLLILPALQWVCPPAAAFAVDAPFDVADKSQLFVDRFLVRESDGVAFRQQPGKKHPANPLLRADRPWEGGSIQIYGDVIFDEQEKLFKMWYIGVGGSTEAQDYFDRRVITHGHLCYATSRDGIHWEKPPVGTLTAKNGKPHNAVSTVEMASVFKEPNEPDPTRRYKMVGYCYDARRQLTYVSPDGLNWRRASDRPITDSIHDVVTAFWDPGRKKYVAFSKKYTQWRGHYRRMFYTATSSDFVDWTAPVLSWKPDLLDDDPAHLLKRFDRLRPLLTRPDDPTFMHTDIYGVGAYAAESCTIAFPWVFSINNKALGGGSAGSIEVQLAVSRDLVNWERPFRSPVIPPGDLDEWDTAFHVTAAHAFRVGDEVWLYYGGGNYTHGLSTLDRRKHNAGIGLATWKLDRFASADGPAEGGSVTTIPIKFSGHRLELNAATGGGGSVVVEICNAAGRRLPEFPPSDPFSGDELRHVVTFGGERDVSALAGKPISLRFRLRDARLFSFAFRD